MPPQPYTTLSQVKNYMGIISTDTSRDGVITALLLPVSRAIDTFCRRQFYLTTESRVYDWSNSRQFWLDKDLFSLTSITNGDGTMVDTTQILLYPLNRQDGPARQVQMKSNGGGLLFNWFMTRQAAITVTGQWGYVEDDGTTPQEITQAANVWLGYMTNESDTLGVVMSKAGNFEVQYQALGEVLKRPPGTVAFMLEGYVWRTYSSFTPDAPGSMTQSPFYLY